MDSSSGLSSEEIEALRAKLAAFDSATAPPVPPAPKIALPHRVGERPKRHVTFTMPGWEGEFTALSRKNMTLEQQLGLRGGDMSILEEVFGDCYDAILGMDETEVIDLMKAWSDASGVAEGESPAA